MGRITYKAFGKKIQNPGAVITAQTFLWARREDGKHLAVKSINKALEMNRFTKVAPNKHIHLLMIRYNIFRRLSSLVRNVLTTRWSLWEGNFCTSKAVSHNLTSYKNNKSRCFALQVALSHLNHFCCVKLKRHEDGNSISFILLMRENQPTIDRFDFSNKAVMIEIMIFWAF